MKKLGLIWCISVTIMSCNNSSSIIGIWREVDKPESYSGYRQILEFASDGTYRLDKYSMISKYNIKGRDIYLTDENGETYKFFEIQTLINDTLILARHYIDTVIYNAITLYRYNYKPYKFDPVICDLAKEYKCFNPDILGNGTLFFKFYDVSLKDEHKLKGIIDRAVGSLPKREKIHEYSRYKRKLFNFYEWETLDYLLKSEMYFDTDKDEIDVKLWATEK